MKKTLMVFMVLSLTVSTFLNQGFITTASANSDEEETFYGEILEINPQRRRVIVVDNRTAEEYEFRVFKSTLSKINLGDQVRIDYSPFSGSFDMFKITNEGNKRKLVRVE